MNEVAVPGGLELLVELERDGSITDTGLKLRYELQPGQYLALASAMGRMHRLSAWVIGDLANHCEHVNGTSYEEIAEATGLAFQTVQNYASVARRVPKSRRRAGVPFSTHQAVAPLSPNEQKEMLRRAVQEEWPRSRIREEIEAATQPQPAALVLPPPRDVTELALAVARAAKESGDLFLVPAPVMRPLLAALGEEN